MPRARENISLTSVDYDIAGNAIRAYYDADKNLIFVLDEAINADKPNVLLVIDSFDERKWDDVLANDYHVDLETVRPKRDNKYQKLDIEYGGLDVYSDLIAAYESGDDLSDAMDNLTRFRAMSVRRAARERLAAAEDTINKSRETIERTNDTISELRNRIKNLRAQLSQQRRGIGREPTKASAAKILKSEAQIDATNEKLSRAKKRLTNAQRRLVVAEEDAEIARAILARDVPHTKPRKSVAPVRSKPQPVLAVPTEPVADDNDDEEEQYEEDYTEYVEEPISEPKAEEMADEEVKPLFDKDPENLDDELAFKPIEFNTDGNNVESVSELPAPADDDIAPAPLSFNSTTQSRVDVNVNNESLTNEPSAPVLNSLTSVQPEPTIEPEPQPAPVVSEPEPAPVVSEPANDSNDDDPFAVKPVASDTSARPVSPIAMTRPVSPMASGTASTVIVSEPKQQKSTVLYYLLLILLILLSIGTLWLYQKSTNGNIPDLAKPVTEMFKSDTESKSDTSYDVSDSDVNIMATVTVEESKPAVKEPEPVAVVETEPVVIEPEPVAVVESKPVAVEPEPVPVVEPVAPVVPEEPKLRTVATYEPEPVRIPTEEEVIASKPGYNVSQNDKMFVASPEYDTETKIIVEEEMYEEPVSECEGGAPMDSLGCCPGEQYMYTDDGFMCCNDVECFPVGN